MTLGPRSPALSGEKEAISPTFSSSERFSCIMRESSVSRGDIVGATFFFGKIENFPAKAEALDQSAEGRK